MHYDSLLFYRKILVKYITNTNSILFTTVIVCFIGLCCFATLFASAIPFDFLVSKSFSYTRYIWFASYILTAHASYLYRTPSLNACLRDTRDYNLLCLPEHAHLPARLPRLPPRTDADPVKNHPPSVSARDEYHNVSRLVNLRLRLPSRVPTTSRCSARRGSGGSLTLPLATRIATVPVAQQYGWERLVGGEKNQPPLLSQHPQLAPSSSLEPAPGPLLPPPPPSLQYPPLPLSLPPPPPRASPA
jgi:hypothetical protein